MIEIRPATLEDCLFVAHCIGMALHIELSEEDRKSGFLELLRFVHGKTCFTVTDRPSSPGKTTSHWDFVWPTMGITIMKSD